MTAKQKKQFKNLWGMNIDDCINHDKVEELVHAKINGTETPEQKKANDILDKLAQKYGIK